MMLEKAHTAGSNLQVVIMNNSVKVRI